MCPMSLVIRHDHVRARKVNFVHVPIASNIEVQHGDLMQRDARYSVGLMCCEDLVYPLLITRATGTTLCPKTMIEFSMIYAY